MVNSCKDLKSSDFVSLLPANLGGDIKNKTWKTCALAVSFKECKRGFILVTAQV